MPEHDPLTERIIGCAFKVANTLGHGFLEKVYENALAHELRKAGLEVVQQQGLEVHYDGVLVGEFQVDLLVEGRVLVELKAVAGILKTNWPRAHYREAREARLPALQLWPEPSGPAVGLRGKKLLPPISLIAARMLRHAGSHEG